MTRFTLKNAGLSTKAITRDERHSIAMFALLSMVLVALIGFAVSLHWQVAAILAVLAIPGSLFAGVLCVLYDRCPRPEKQPEASRPASLPRLVLTVISGIVIYIALCYEIPDQQTRLIAAIALVALSALAQRVRGRYDGLP